MYEIIIIGGGLAGFCVCRKCTKGAANDFRNGLGRFLGSFGRAGGRYICPRRPAPTLHTVRALPHLRNRPAANMQRAAGRPGTPVFQLIFHPHPTLAPYGCSCFRATYPGTGPAGRYSHPALCLGPLGPHGAVLRLRLHHLPE